MSIEVRNLSRWYGRQCAVDNISFSVRKGEVAGFLGPNGAGKSTTMKIITGFLSPSSGEVSVCGNGIGKSGPDSRAIIGYLPEHNPLYPEMYVHEYLAFCGGFYPSMEKSLQSRIKEVVHTCGLAQEQNKKIQQLSRGYRQRVGLAQALLHDPEVLILDEPTSGLDPNQLLEIRSLIRAVSKDKTVLFSTHIMQEVEAVCDRVIVIHQGKLVADDPIDKLTAIGTGKAMIAEFEIEIEESELVLAGGIKPVRCGEKKFRYDSGTEDLRSVIFRHAAERNLPLVGLKEEAASVEDVFRSLTSGNGKKEPE